MPEFLTKINWVDIACAVIFLRAIYVARKTGFLIELSKLISLIFTACLSLHYFLVISDLILNRVNLEKSPLQFLETSPLQFTDFVVFTLFLTIFYALLSILRSIIFNLIRPNQQARPVSFPSAVTAMLLSVVRGFLISSLLIFSLYISKVDYLNKNSRKAYFGKSLFGISTGIYKNIWEGVASKFLPNEKINSVVFDHEKEFYQ